jgi:glycosyltransferase involved in cell wall biosynthesis
MTNWLKLYDSIIFLSQFYKDYEFAKSKGIENLHIIPNGASEQEFKSESKFNIYEYLKISTGNNLILHVGNFTGIKGHFEAIHIFRKSKLENAHLVLCGQNFFSPEAFNLRILISPLKCISDKRILHPRNLIKAIWNLFSSKKNIHFLALDRSNLIDAYRQASLVLFPSNLECSPIVLFESMASSIPILITDVGNAREIVSKYNVGYILPTSRNKNGLGRTRIDQAALLLKFIISEKSILSIKGVNGFKAWNSNYTWEKITKQYEKLYQKSL